MKASYKIALILSVVVCVLAIVLFKGKNPPQSTQASNDTSTAPDNTETRKTLRSDSQGDGSLKSIVNAKPPTPSNKKTDSIASDARKRILAANTSPNQDTPQTETKKPPTVLTIGGNPTGGIALARTEAGPSKVTAKPKPTTKVTAQALDAVLASSDTTKSTKLTTPPAKPDPNDTPNNSDTDKTYTVQPGDLLSTIAVKLYDDERRWVDIAQANPRVEPTKLRVGQVLRLPDASHTLSKEEPVPPAPGNIQTYTIQPGDSLSTVAQKYYNDPTLWRTIYNFNRKKIGDNPNAIQAGMTLKVPPRLTGAQ
jgi:nucleoid-associated protein YgaU